MPLATSSSLPEIPSFAQQLKTGDEVTIWPLRGRGESYDTEPGLQPWKAEFLGWTTDGRLIISTEKGNTRFISAERLSPS